MQKLTSCPYNEAQKLSLDLANAKLLSEWIPVYNSLERVIAKGVTCKKDLPSFNNSALDGYAINYKDIGKKLKIKETIFAGDSFSGILEENECYKIMTGAKIPSDADTIVAFENAEILEDNFVQIPQNIKKGNAFRVKGEEISYGDTLFSDGTIINSSCVALLASQGISQVEVYKKLSIAIFSTGNELREPWESANEDEIYNVNSSSLIALFEEYGFKADYCGVIPDNLEQSKAYFQKMKSYDFLVTTGGISMGEADFVEDALLYNGLKSLFHGINIKPGRPTMIGKMDNTIVASMPGNPLAAYVNAFLFLIPLLKKLQGNNDFEHKKIKAKIAKELKLKAKRTNLVLGNFKDGLFNVTMNNKYGSGMITPIFKSNAILITSNEQSLICKNEEIEIILFKGSF
ncbi:MAG: molybdopterin molybdotransferase MoeA [Epsilonproteobacteria bacterium]|nr:molybdopterin molybdotransferase MoeA [Campylobacterota bacterium]